jgi:8-oxo-dGTP pyrophosphatase MutT (NUDIX family)
MRNLWRRSVAAAAGALCTARLAHCDRDPGQLQRARVTGSTEVGSTRFLRLNTLTYEDAIGRKRKWDVATRTTRKGDVDGVAILALLRRRAAPEDVELLLVHQFRPPMNAVTVELPAGLIDPGESAEVAALRELKEETGYTGTSAFVSGRLAMSPGLTDETVQLCVVEVDLDAPANAIPEQCLEDTEFIKVTRVPVRKLLPKLKEMERAGAVPFMGLFTLAVGLQMSGSLSSAALGD